MRYSGRTPALASIRAVGSGVCVAVLVLGLSWSAVAQTMWEDLDSSGDAIDQTTQNLVDGNCAVSDAVGRGLTGRGAEVAELLQQVINNYTEAAVQLRELIRSGEFAGRAIPDSTPGREQVGRLFDGPPQTIEQVLSVLADNAEVAVQAAQQIPGAGDAPDDVVRLTEASGNIVLLMGFLGEALLASG